MFALYNLNQKYKGKPCVDYLTEADVKRNNYISNFYKQHPALSRDCAMAYQVLLYNKDLTEEDKVLFTKRLEDIRKSEEEKMKSLYREFMKRDLLDETINSYLEPKETDMDVYIDKDKDVFGEVNLNENKIDA